MGIENKPEMHEIKKHAAAIHCSNASSLLQRKITNALLYHAYKELLLKDEHEISVKQLCTLISYQGNNHSVIKDALRGLLSTVIEWNLVNDKTGQEDWTASSILASVSLQGPTCLYAYSPRMKQLLHSPSMFGKINLFIQSRFKSSYGLALYENCVRYRGLAHTKWFEMDLFRKLMGVPSGKYTIFRDFKRRVLDKSIEEVNTYSDVIVEPELLREGRQVVKIRFIMKDRAKKTRLGSSAQGDEGVETETTMETAIKTKLVDQYGLLSDQCEQMFIEFGVEFIAEKIEMIESSANFVQGRVKNLAAYLFSALKNNYQNPKSSLVKVAEKRQQVADRKSVQRVVDKIKDEYDEYRMQMTEAAIEELSVENRESFQAAFYEHAGSAINTVLKLQRNKYTRQTVLHSPQIKVMLKQYALQELPSLQDALISMEEFVETMTEAQQAAWKEFNAMKV
jgi:plasmid replication initiation protein